MDKEVFTAKTFITVWELIGTLGVLYILLLKKSKQQKR